MSKRKLWSVARVRDPRFPGIVVRITELKKNGPLYSAQRLDGKTIWHKLNPEVTRLSLGRTEKEQRDGATKIALDLVRRIAEEPDESSPSASAGGGFTLAQLVQRFEVDGLHGRTKRFGRDMTAALHRVRDVLGSDKVVLSLKPSDLRRYLAQRPGLRVAGQRDLVLVSIVVNWAIGEGLLPEDSANPLGKKKARDVLKVTHEPRRPVATKERYEALRAVAGTLPPAFGVLLDLSWHAGHRISAMLGDRDGEFPALRWRDVSFKATKAAPHGAITWYAGIKPDRKKHEHVVAMNAQASATLALWQKQTAAFGAAFVFPHPRDQAKPLPYYDAKRWLRQAERRAKLAHEPQGGWHMYRRGWATARKPFPKKDVAKGGGWSENDTTSLETCYQHADEETTQKVALFVA